MTAMQSSSCTEAVLPCYQPHWSVITEEVTRTISKTPGFGAPGPNNDIIAFWWKSFFSVHDQLAQIFTYFFRGEC